MGGGIEVFLIPIGVMGVCAVLPTMGYTTADRSSGPVNIGTPGADPSETGVEVTPPDNFLD